MKIFNSRSFLLVAISSLVISSCSDSKFAEINTDPNNPPFVPTTTLIVNAQKQAIDAVRSPGVNLRGAALFAQFYAQNIYTDPSRYIIPTAASDNFWRDSYLALNNINEIITLNSDEKTKAIVSAGTAGSNSNQIAVARILKSFVFHQLTDVFGNIPYESYGTKNEDFQALQHNPDNLTPKYATQEKIYLDILKELDQAADTLYKYQDRNTFGKADIIYQGDNKKWYKFANSLRLRLATRIFNQSNTVAKQHIEDAIAQGVFSSNADNAVFKYTATSPNQAPLYKATVIENRKDFAVSHVIVETLSGQRGPFKTVDPRLEKYANKNEENKYLGQPYGLPLEAGNILPFNKVSLPSTGVNAANFGEVLQEYAEVEFLLSEYKNWDQTHYRNGVIASLEKWGVSAAGYSAYIQALPAATAENVLSQKYIALYTQGIEGWTEIRRTGYPKFLVKKGDLLWKGLVGKVEKSYHFDPEFSEAIPNRLVYPLNEQRTNKSHYQESLAQQGDDVITTKLWWNK